MPNRFAVAFLTAACAFAPLVSQAAVLPPAPQPAERFDVGILHVDRYGSGAPIVLVPGLASGAWTWNAVIPHLAAAHSVYAVTLAGFDGRPAAGAAGFDAFERDLTALLDQRRIVKAVLVGHSLGGTLALAYAEARPDRVRAVVAADGLPIVPGMQQLSAEQRRAAGAQAAASVSAQSPQQFLAYETAYMTAVGVSDPALAGELAALSARSTPSAVAAWLGADLAADLRPELAKITAPVLEIAPYSPAEGEPTAPVHYSEAQKRDYYRALLDGVSNLDVVTIAPARHFVMFDQPARFAQVLDAFLARV
jgi:pimeloyl-ACP methyl ester carboxylesterase